MVLASAVLRGLFPEHATLGATLPAGAPLQSFVLEALLTLILMVVILCVATGAKEKGIMAGVAVGAVIAVEALFAGPVSGASMNPARSLAPALVTLRLEGLWIYLAAPVLGAAGGVVVCRPFCTAGIVHRRLAGVGARRLLDVMDISWGIAAQHVGVHHREPRPDQILKELNADQRRMLFHLEGVSVQLEDRLSPGLEKTMDVVQIAFALGD
jgi:hypothetical protein